MKIMVINWIMFLLFVSVVPVAINSMARAEDRLMETIWWLVAIGDLIVAIRFGIKVFS